MFKWKKLDVNLILFVCVTVTCLFACNNPSNDSENGINKNALKNDTSFNGALDEYTVDSCLYKLLDEVVLSNNDYYKPDHFFYSLEWRKHKENRFMVLSRAHWEESFKMDYNGVIKIRQSMILCNGDFKSDSIFHRQANKVKVKLKFGENMIPSTLEPSLQGHFNDCDNVPIYIEVYTKGKISNYKEATRLY